MFTYLYRSQNKKIGYLIFLIIPIVIGIDYVAGIFIGGLFVISTVVSIIILPRLMFGLFVTLEISTYCYFASISGRPSKTIIIQGTILVISLLFAAIVGYEIQKYIENLNIKKKENCNLTKELIYSFITAIDAKDHYLHNHSSNVSHYTRKIAMELQMDGREAEAVTLAALFHDIGKLSVSEEILNKPERLNDEEWRSMQNHTIAGVDILKNIKKLEYIIPYIKYHHLHYDGSGYPIDCPIEEVPFESRIIAVADAFDAMTSDRPYRKALPVEAAYEELRKCSGSQFDPKVVDAFFAAEIVPERKETFDVDLMMVFEG